MYNYPNRFELEMYLEQGSEGAHWSIYDKSKKGYDGLITLKEGMHILIPDVWEGVIKYDKVTNRKWFHWCKPYAKVNDYRALLENRGFDTMEWSNEDCELVARDSFTQQVAGGYYCHWVQEGVDPDVWAQWFIDELPVEIL